MDLTPLRLAGKQYGVMSRGQARKLGMSEETFRGLTRFRGWESVLPNVVRAPGFPPSWLQELKALCLWGEPGCAASHRAAAALHGLAGFPEGTLEIATVKRCRVSGVTVVAHRIVPLRACLTVVRGIPTMNELHTLMVLGGVASLEQVRRAVDDALHRGLVTVSGLRWILKEYARPGLTGAGVLREVVAFLGFDYVPTESELEAAFLLLLRRANLVLPELQVRMGSRRHDFIYRLLNLVIELDGYTTHGTRDQFHEDRERDNLLAVRGNAVLRFTWYDVHQRPDYVIALLRAMGVGRRPGRPRSATAGLLGADRNQVRS